MIIDRLENLDRYVEMHPGFEAAFDLIRNFDFDAAEDGPAEIDGERLTINVLRRDLKTKDAAKLEAHERYVDIQVMFSGEEVFGWKLTDECEQPQAPYNAEKDVILYDDTPDGYWPLLENMFVIFFPEDAHAPMVGEGKVEKLVVKVLL
ncbi:MAG: YhcH/YjgK/YiaL family protein [Armatimonadota bacterium]|jgi:biofilm protein TabA